MATQFAMATLVIKDYDEAIDFFVNKLLFTLIEDTPLTDTKRWVVVSPNGSRGAKILLAKAAGDQQLAAVGNQAGGRVAFFMHTDNFDTDYHTFLNNGIRFVRQPVKEPYGTVAVFEDLYGNLWDLIG